jgi:hypothetical protein
LIRSIAGTAEPALVAAEDFAVEGGGVDANVSAGIAGQEKEDEQDVKRFVNLGWRVVKKRAKGLEPSTASLEG